MTAQTATARPKHAKIVATLGPASDGADAIEALFRAGADVFRLNFSHGAHEDHRRRLAAIRTVEARVGRPIGVLLDLQGPKLRIGCFADGAVTLAAGQAFRLELQRTEGGTAAAVGLPHPEIFAVLQPGMALLLDDGRVRLEVLAHGADWADTRVTVGGRLSDRKGVNLPGAVLPVSALTPKDRADLAFGLELGVDYVALSFVQRAEDVAALRDAIGGRAAIVAKLEKPAAIDALEAIVAEADAVMVARGDLGVEMDAEEVPAIQKRIVQACRRAGKPVIVATQMLESMVGAPVPTRAEASDVATAVYEGADAVMLSAESATGQYPLEAVQMMRRIIRKTESDPNYRTGIDASRTGPRPTTADAIGTAMRDIVQLLRPAATVAYTSSGYSALRMARERPQAPVVGMTPQLQTARRLALTWGVYPVLCPEVHDVPEMGELALRTVRDHGLGGDGDTIVISAGMPFGESGTTNLLRVMQL